MKKLLVAAMLCLGSLTAVSADADLAWQCNLEGNIDGYDAGFIISVGYLKGEAHLDCTSINGDTVTKKVMLKMVALGFGYDLARITNVDVKAFNVGVSDPGQMTRQFRVSISAGATLFNLGYEPDLSLQLSNGGVAFELGLFSKEAIGLGAHIRRNILTISEI